MPLLPTPVGGLAKAKLEAVMRFGVKARGRLELIRFLEGKRLCPSHAIRAHCYECMGFYTDGVEKCLNPTCTLYPYNPYAKLPQRPNSTPPASQDAAKAGKRAKGRKTGTGQITTL